MAETNSSQKLQIFIFTLLSQFYLVFNSAQIYPIEILFCFYVMANLRKVSLSSGFVRWVLPFLALWLFGSIMSDLVNLTQGFDALKGALRVLFLAANFLAFALLCQTQRSTVIAWTGLASGLTLVNFIQPNIYFAGDHWKWGFAIPFTLLFVVLLDRSESTPGKTIVLTLSFAGVNVFLGFRSLALVLVLMATFFFIHWMSHRQATKPEVAPKGVTWRALLSFSFVLITISALLSYYDRLAVSGLFGSAAQVKASFQGAGSFGSLLSGRPETFMGVATIAESPFFGLGSFAKPTASAYEAGAEFFSQFGYEKVAVNFDQQGYGFHSEIFGMIAENGFLASFFWISLLLYLLQAGRVMLSRNERPSALISFLIVIGLWDLFYSPFGADRRVWIGLTIVSIHLYLERNKREQVENKRSHHQPKSD